MSQFQLVFEYEFTEFHLRVFSYDYIEQKLPKKSKYKNLINVIVSVIKNI